MSSMNIVYACDDYYVKILAISMISLFRHHKSYEFNIYLLDCGIKEESKEILKSICKEYNQDLRFCLMDKYMDRLILNMGERKIAIASYARLFLTSVLPNEIDKVLYMDCDTLVNGSLDLLWGTMLKDKLIAGVGDTVDLFFKKKLGILEKEIYMNAGLLLIPLDVWRKEKLEEKFIETIQKFNGNVPHHDQGVLNLVCSNRKLLLPLKYNVTSNIYSFSRTSLLRMYEMKNFYKEKEMEEAKKNPSILHFTSGIVGRPWHKNCKHPKKEIYASIRELTPWKGEILEIEDRSLQVRIFSCLYNKWSKKLAVFLYLVLSKVIRYKESKSYDKF